MIVFLYTQYQSWREKTCWSKMSYICLSFQLFQLKKSSVFKSENGQNQSTLLAFPSSFLIWLVYVAFQRTQKAFIWGRQLSDLHPTPPLSCTQERVGTRYRTRKSYEDHPFCCRHQWIHPIPIVGWQPIRVVPATLFSQLFSSFCFRPNRMIFPYRVSSTVHTNSR
jgi:hypothetical protein